MAPGRVVLRALTAADRGAFLAAMRNSQGLHAPWLSPPRTAPAFANLLRRSSDERFESLLVLEGRSERYLKVAGRWRDHERWAIRVEQWRARCPRA